MTRSIILDTGPLVAFLFRRERDHDWAKQQFAGATTFFTCEAVLTEASYLLRNLKGSTKALMACSTTASSSPCFD